jgi:hypothetical protein
MKNMRSMKMWSAMLMVLAIICMLAAPATSQAQVTPTATGEFLGSTYLINGSVTSNINTSAISVRQAKGLAFLPLLAGTNASTAAVTFVFDVSVDGTNFTTSSPLAFAVAMNGTTAVRGYTNFSSTLLDNVSHLRLRSIQNAHTASVFVTNAVWSVKN